MAQMLQNVLVAMSCLILQQMWDVIPHVTRSNIVSKVRVYTARIAEA